MLSDPSSDPSESSAVSKLQQQLKSSNEVQAKFLSFLSHDLRGELNGVLLTVELLKHQFSNEPRLAQSVEDLDAIRGAILGAVGVMERFIKAERLRHGRIVPKNVAVDVTQLLAEVAGEFAAEVKAKGLELVIESPQPVQINTDKDLLKMILQNVVSNAIKFSSHSLVRLKADPAEGSLGPRICVIDQGPGISIERQAKLFEPFVGGQVPGKCIGLYLVQQATDLLGAKLSVDANPGSGATFAFEFPK
jgi:signal transduction histidine kinase